MPTCLIIYGLPVIDRGHFHFRACFVLPVNPFGYKKNAQSVIKSLHSLPVAERGHLGVVFILAHPFVRGNNEKERETFSTLSSTDIVVRAHCYLLYLIHYATSTKHEFASLRVLLCRPPAAVFPDYLGSRIHLEEVREDHNSRIWLDADRVYLVGWGTYREHEPNLKLLLQKFFR